MSYALPLSDHPLRQELSAEVHARPYMHLSKNERASHLALLTGEHGADEERALVAELCRKHGQPAPAEGSNFHAVELGDYRLRWERHTEFTSYSFFARGEVFSYGQADDRERFAHTAMDFVPSDWLSRLPGQVLVGIHMEMEDDPGEGEEVDADELERILEIQNFAGSAVSGGAARAWMNFTINSDGFGRILVRDRHLRPRQAGRLVQRLFEIETYRMLSLLGLPLARRHGAELTELGNSLMDITAEFARCDALESEQALLAQLTDLSSEIERIAAATNFRFGATRAYYELVRRRITELREERIEGIQTIGEFMDRRLAPAANTCVAVSDRLDTLSKRVARASQLLRTRVDIKLEGQNRNLLETMSRRAKLQLLLQETVESLSVAAITYYGVGLVSYAAESLKASGLDVPGSFLDMTPGLAIPVVAGLVWFGMRRVRHLIGREVKDEMAQED
ncbi:DUF3422 family protein [Fodinicurvata halophila]|uniref:DUF3422 family protein n=1 Tax=Fodinicurvata halophila TaxID=1419723 RepID=A0ABV8UJ24_9PROT